ncbi:MAG: 3-hydroxybutyrate dehydrogenase [Parvibaculaceae bacterium]
MELEGKTALVTGSTSGLGKAIAEKLARAGAGIIVTGLGDAAAIERQCDEMRQHGGKVTFYPADVTDPQQVADLLARAVRDNPTIDILVNNAGTQHICPLESFPLAEWDRVLAVNLTAPFRMIRGLIGAMKERRWGRIINISSVHGLVGSPDKSAYVASKHGIVGLTKVAALEGARFGVTCNAICPGWIMTPLSARQITSVAERTGVSFEEARKNLLIEKQPSLEFAELEEVAGLALFLCTQAAAQVNGAALPIDGAWTAQ